MIITRETILLENELLKNYKSMKLKYKNLPKYKENYYHDP